MKCPYCGHLQRDARFCENCGASISQSQGYEYPDINIGAEPASPEQPPESLREESFMPPPLQSYFPPEPPNSFQPSEPQSGPRPSQGFFPPEPQSYFRPPQGYFQPEQQSSGHKPPQDPDPQQAFLQQQDFYQPPGIYQPPQNPYRPDGRIYSDTHFNGSNNYTNTASANSRASASLVLGILSLLFFGLGSILGIIAIVLGVSAKRALRQAGAPSGNATAGIILGAVSAALFAIVIFSLLSL